MIGIVTISKASVNTQSACKTAHSKRRLWNKLPTLCFLIHRILYFSSYYQANYIKVVGMDVNDVLFCDRELALLDFIINDELLSGQLNERLSLYNMDENRGFLLRPGYRKIKFS